MLDQELLKELSEKFFSNLPQALNLDLAKEEVSKSIKLVLTQAVNSLNLVTREQFDTQAKMLKIAQEQLDFLTKKVEEIEKK